MWADPRAEPAPYGAGWTLGTIATILSNLNPGHSFAEDAQLTDLSAGRNPGRKGRRSLAAPAIQESLPEEVTAPTLLIVGGRDETVLDLNRRAQAELRCENHLAVVPGATHLFEEPGTLATAAELARDWFLSHLTRGRDPA